MGNRIAVELYGHLRTFEHTAHSFHEKFLNTHKARGWEIDIFIHTWTQTNHSDITWSNPKGEKRGIELDGGLLERMKSFYNPVKYLVEEQLTVEDYMLTCKVGGSKKEYKVMANLAYTKYKTAWLRREYAKASSIEYDYVIAVRPDLYFKTPFCIDDYLEMYPRWEFPVPQGVLFFPYKPFDRGRVDDEQFIVLSDLLYFGTPDAMDKAASYYELIASGEITAKKMDEDFYYGEIVFMNHWLKSGLRPLRIKYFAPQDFYILRSKEGLPKMEPPKEAPSKRTKKKKSFLRQIFSIRSQHEGNAQWKIITICGIKIRITK